MEKNIIRIEKQKNYVVMSNIFLNNNCLSLKAKGLLAYLLSLPDDWKIYIDELTNHHTDGKDSIASAINELIHHKYLHRKKIRENGKFGGYSYKLFEEPTEINVTTVTGFPVNGLPVNGFSVNGKPATTKYESKLNINNTNYEQQQQPENILENNIENKKEEKSVVVVDNLIVKFNKKYGGNLDHNLLKNLIKIKSYDVVEKCIDEFENYIINANQVEKVFYDFCMKHGTDKAYKKNTAYKSNTVNNQPIQSTNYNQREYDDDFFNSLYKNYEYVKDEL